MQLARGYTKISFTTKDGKKHTLQSPAWLMDVLFRGAIAKDEPCFLVEDSAALVQIGVSPKAKRDRYSYNELLPGRAKLAELSAQYGEKQKKHEQNEEHNPKLTIDESLVLKLGRNISTFEFLLGQFSFARKGDFLVNEAILPPELKQLAAKLDIGEMLDRMPEMTVDQLFQAVRQGSGKTEDERIFAAAMRLFFFHASSAQRLNLIPPEDRSNEVWSSLGNVMLTGLAKKKSRPWAKKQIKKIQTLVDAVKEGDTAFTAALQQFSYEQRAEATARGEGKHSGMEVAMYHGDYFKLALEFFILAFVIMAVGWLAPGSQFGRIMALIACLTVMIGILLDAYGITLRCIIRSRPPITNLYDTILFITAVAALLGLLLEYFTRIGVGLLVAVVSGVLGMFLAMNYEAKEATDTIAQVVAVLDTNIWLATHVVIINIGYGGGMVAALLAMVYLMGRFVVTLIGKEKESREVFKTLFRMTYGIICFCLFFSLVGTVLGGIWANYSWGRFWGWDPKENGALMICLWSLVILHARMGGYIRELGVNMNAVILGVLVTFSWFGVNNLGVGLHSYGFTEGVRNALYTTWAVMAIPFLMGVAIFFIERSRKNTPPEPGAEGLTVGSS